MMAQHFEVQSMRTDQIRDALDSLVSLLKEAVDSGSSLSFLPPLQVETAQEYWLSVAQQSALGTRHILGVLDGAQVVGTVQLVLAAQPNATHRVEVQKLIVRHSHRRRGIGRLLMQAVEKHALSLGRSLIVLDTQMGSEAEELYQNLGYQRAGIIPGFARDGQGGFIATVIYYRQLS